MARTRSSITTGTTENNIYFYPAGGHSHDGQNSSLIDATKYSVYDFNFGYISDNPVRRQFQINSFESLKQVIRDTVTDSILTPAGIVLQPNTLNGATIIARTIEAGQIVANTLTANEIAANTITADELVSNIILVNNIIRSNNYSAGSAGWIISNNGSAEFNNITVRGTISSNSGNIAGWSIASNRLFSGSTSLYSNGTGIFGNTTIYSNGQITNGNFTVYANGVMTASGASFSGTITGTTMTGSTITGGTVQTATTGRRVVLNSGGIRIFKADGVSEAFALYQNDQLYVDSIVLYGGNQSGPSYKWAIIDNGAYFPGSVSVYNTDGAGPKFACYPDDAIKIYAELRGVADASAYNYVIGHPTTNELARWTSSIKYKEDVFDMEDVGNYIDSLRPVTFIAKAIGEETEELSWIRKRSKNYGFIAEEVAEINQGYLATWNETADGNTFEPTAWRITDMIAISIKELQSLRNRVKDLENIVYGV